LPNIRKEVAFYLKRERKEILEEELRSLFNSSLKTVIASPSEKERSISKIY